MPAGIIVFPAAYLATDIIVEIYGYSVSRRIIWSGAAALVLMVASYEVARLLPPASFWSGQSAFDQTLAQVPRIVTASIVAYFAGDFANSFVLAKMKVWSEGRGMAVRFVASTLVGQLLDTSVFVFIAFTGVFPAMDLMGVVLSAWLVKSAWEVIALPITLPIVRWLKRAENQDHFDRDTDFNPFLIR